MKVIFLYYWRNKENTHYISMKIIISNKSIFLGSRLFIFYKKLKFYLKENYLIIYQWVNYHSKFFLTNQRANNENSILDIPFYYYVKKSHIILMYLLTFICFVWYCLIYYRGLWQHRFYTYIYHFRTLLNNIFSIKKSFLILQKMNYLSNSLKSKENSIIFNLFIKIA